MKKFKLSINKNMVNKAYAGMKGWHNTFMNLSEFVEHIGRGYAWGVGSLFENCGDGKPKSSDIEQLELIGIDIDNVQKVKQADGTWLDVVLTDGYFSFEDAKRDYYINEYALLIHTSASSTPECNKFRIIFLLDKAIKDHAYYKRIVTKLIDKFQADKACKDVSRFYYGALNCEIKTFNKFLNDNAIKRLFESEVETTERKLTGVFEKSKPSETKIVEILQHIPGDGIGYEDWLKISTVVKNNYDLQTATQIIDEWAPDKDIGTKRKLMSLGNAPSEIGYIVNFAKQFGYIASSIDNSYINAGSYTNIEFIGNNAPIKSNVVVSENGALFDNSVFWKITEPKTPNAEPKLVLLHAKLYQIFVNNNFKNYKRDNEYQIIKINDNRVSTYQIPELRKWLFDFIDAKISDNIGGYFTKNDLIEIVTRDIKKLLATEKLDFFLPVAEINFRYDTEDEAVFYYKNCWVTVDVDGIKEHQYSELNYYIWESKIIERDYVYRDYSTFDFWLFLQRTCTNRATGILEQARFDAVQSAIGYLLHDHRESANKKAVIFCESNKNNTEKGGTGKGIIVQGIGKMRKHSFIDAKLFNPNDKFAFQSVDENACVISFDDAPENFNFKNLYVMITEGLSIERKKEHKIVFTPTTTPKIAITTNYAIQGRNSSDQRRRYDVALLDYYSSENLPTDEFKKYFFSQWDAHDYEFFDSLMLDTVSRYFALKRLNGGKMPICDLIDILEREFTQSVPEEFLEFSYSIESDTEYIKDELYDNYVKSVNKSSRAGNITKQGFTKLLEKYAKFKNLNMEVYRKRGSWIGQKSFVMFKILGSKIEPPNIFDDNAAPDF